MFCYTIQVCLDYTNSRAKLCVRESELFSKMCCCPLALSSWHLPEKYDQPPLEFIALNFNAWAHSLRKQSYLGSTSQIWTPFIRKASLQT